MLYSTLFALHASLAQQHGHLVQSQEENRSTRLRPQAELFTQAQKVIDSVADKGIFHKNKAARHKSRLSAKIKALAVAA